MIPRRAALAAALALGLVVPVAGGAQMSRALLPVARGEAPGEGGGEGDVPESHGAALTTAGPDLPVRIAPRLRPPRPAAPVQGRDPASVATVGVGRFADAPSGPVGVSLVPRARPQEVREQARAVAAMRAQGAVCGDIGIQGVVVGRVPSTVAGCGVDEAVRVRSVGGVALSTHAVMDCGTARALKRWVDGGLKPAVGGWGGGVARLQVAAHYACRPRNNQAGSKISEHGRGRAVDIAAIVLADGEVLSVEQDWGKGRAGRILEASHAAACGPFGTVLGPRADVFHRDHFHFDTARYRSGSYCR